MNILINETLPEQHCNYFVVCHNELCFCCVVDTAGEMVLADVALNILSLLMKEQWSWLCSENIQRTVRLLFGTLINRWPVQSLFRTWSNDDGMQQESPTKKVWFYSHLFDGRHFILFIFLNRNKTFLKKTNKRYQFLDEIPQISNKSVSPCSFCLHTNMFACSKCVFSVSMVMLSKHNSL